MTPAGTFSRETPGGFARKSAGTVLVARLDNAGDVLLQGPLVRAVAAAAEIGRAHV